MFVVLCFPLGLGECKCFTKIRLSQCEVAGFVTEEVVPDLQTRCACTPLLWMLYQSRSERGIPRPLLSVSNTAVGLDLEKSSGNLALVSVSPGTIQRYV